LLSHVLSCVEETQRDFERHIARLCKAVGSYSCTCMRCWETLKTQKENRERAIILSSSAGSRPPPCKPWRPCKSLRVRKMVVNWTHCAQTVKQQNMAVTQISPCEKDACELDTLRTDSGPGLLSSTLPLDDSKARYTQTVLGSAISIDNHFDRRSTFTG